tara:strand:+ start:3559 stop:3927 length:369 start_codon:yes stop_codon:yes gene_type:complete
MTEQEIINDFFRKYVDRGFKTTINAVKLNPGHTEEHKRTIFEACNSLLNNGIPFWTEVRLKCGRIPDIVAPTHVTPFIEILSSETVEDFRTTKGPTYETMGVPIKSVKLIETTPIWDEKCLF